MSKRLACALWWLAGCAATPREPLLAQADALRRAGDETQAYGRYAAALCAEPSWVAARRLVESGQALGRPGSPETRIADCKIDVPVMCYLEGLAAATRGENVAADAKLAEAEGLLPAAERGEPAYRRGLLWLNAGDAARARPHLERAAALQPGLVDVRLALAQALLLAGDSAAVVSTLDGMLALSPTSADLQRARKIMASAVRRSEPALPAGVDESIQKLLADLEHGDVGATQLATATALALRVEHPRVLTVAGLVALRQGLELEALRLLERASELSPLDSTPMRVLGAGYWAAQRSREALPPLREALRRDPFDAETASMLASAASAVGEFDVAAQTYRRLTALEPLVAEHFLWLARSERQLGHADAARRAAEQGCKLQGKNVSLLLELASIDADEAVQAPTAAERDDAAVRSREVVARLVEVAPEHPGAAAILSRLDGTQQ